MTNPVLSEELPGFDEPLALLRACHDKIIAHCELIEQIVGALQGQDEDFDTRAAARQVMNYFSRSARQHHQDEEQDLFPLLIRQSLKLADLINSLKQEHRTLDELWQTMEPELRRMPEPSDPDAFIAAASAFCSLNREHVVRENSDFLPVARSSLSSQQIRDIGRAMAQRRGAPYPVS
jgi:hemerythrin-like domain-containing protein